MIFQPINTMPCDDAQPTGGSCCSSKPAITWDRYRPLLLVLAYVIGATALTQSMAGRWDARQAMTHFMGFFFLGFAFFKLLGVRGFADAFATYDPIAQRIRGYGLAYPFIELTLGGLYVTGYYVTWANVAVIGLLGIGLIGVVRSVRQGQAVQCACLGTAFDLPMSSVTIAENSVMIAMAAGMLWW